MKTKRIPILGAYTAMDLHRAMIAALKRQRIRESNARSEFDPRQSCPVGCDVRPDGTIIPL